MTQQPSIGGPTSGGPVAGSGSEHALAQHLARFPARTLLVLGDVMLDRYVLGDVRRISSEAPIPVLHAQSRRAVLGGAGNVAQNAAALGARVVLVGAVGTDGPADEAATILAADRRIASRLVAVAGRPTTVKTRFMSGGHQLLRLDEEVTTPLAPAMEDAILAAFAAALPEADVVVVSDYAKGVLTDAVLRGAIAAARAAGKPVVVDPKRPTFAAYAGADVLTPNAMEAARATGIDCADDAGAARAALATRAQSACGAVLVKRSEKGLTLVEGDAAPLHIPTRAQAVADVSGAGDTLVTAFALAPRPSATSPPASSSASPAPPPSPMPSSPRRSTAPSCSPSTTR